jgi:hypothetical protein
VSTTPAAELRLQLLSSGEESHLATDLRQRLNRPGSPTVEVTIAGVTVSCIAATWEPLLRVRVEMALEEIFGNVWRELVRWA